MAVEKQNGIVERMEEFLLEDIRPRMKASPQISDVVVWIKEFDEETGTLHLGLALSAGVGCSPFCGCAARQIAELIGYELSQKFPEIKRVVGYAEIPPDDWLKKWQEEN